MELENEEPIAELKALEETKRNLPDLERAFLGYLTRRGLINHLDDVGIGITDQTSPPEVRITVRARDSSRNIIEKNLAEEFNFRGRTYKVHIMY